MRKEIVNMNGEIVPGNMASVSIFDRGFLFGDSVYEVLMAYEKKPFLLEEHLDRLWNSATRLGINFSLSKERLGQEITRTVQKLGVDYTYVRTIVTRGIGEVDLDPSGNFHSNYFIIAKPGPQYPKEWYTDGVKIIISKVIRNNKESLDPNIKSGNYLNNLLALKEAKEAKVLDAVMVNRHGYLTEGTTNNIWLVKDGVIKTPELGAGLLRGITRTVIIDIAKRNKMALEECLLRPEELLEADEAFTSSTTKEVLPVTSVNGKPIANGRPGKVTNQLIKLYKDYVKEKK